MKQKLQFHSTSVKQIVDITVPMMIDQLFLVGFNFINTFMISSSGETAISAVNMVGILNVFFAQISSAVELAATVLIAQWSVQKSKRDKLGMLSRQAILTNLGINVTLAVVLLASHQALLGLLFGQVDPELIRLSSLLFVGMILCYPLQSIVDGINGSLRGITKTKHSLMVSLSMNVMYLLGNVVLLTVFHLEILGLAISLVCSRICGVMIATLVYRRQSLFKDAVTGMQKWALQKRFVGLVALTTIPFAVENLFFNGGKIVIQSMISILGTATIAANGVLNTLMPIAEIIPASLAMAIVPIVGKMVGAKEYQDIGKVLRLFLGVCAVFLLVFNVAMYPVYQHVSDIFHVSQEAAGLIQGVYVYLIVAHPAIWALSFVTPAALRAMNEGKFTTIVALCSMWTIRVLMAYIVLQFGGNLVGVYVVMMLEWGVRGVIFVTKFIRKNRQQLQLATQVEIED